MRFYGWGSLPWQARCSLDGSGHLWHYHKVSTSLSFSPSLLLSSSPLSFLPCSRSRKLAAPSRRLCSTTKESWSFSPSLTSCILPPCLSYFHLRSPLNTRVIILARAQHASSLCPSVHCEEGYHKVHAWTHCTSFVIFLFSFYSFVFVVFILFISFTYKDTKNNMPTIQLRLQRLLSFVLEL